MELCWLTRDCSLQGATEHTKWLVPSEMCCECKKTPQISEVSFQRKKAKDLINNCISIICMLK